METFLRTWRDDAAERHQYDSAIFVGDKLLAFSELDEDAIALARIYLLNTNYTRALSILQRRDLIPRTVECQYLAAQCHVGSGSFNEALLVLGEKTPAQVLTFTSHNRRKIPRTAGIKHAKGTKPVTNGSHVESKPEEDRAADEQRRKNTRYYAGIAYLRGLCYAKQNALDRAKECYKEAVMIDVQCYEAFDQLMKNQLMSPPEEKQFLEDLNFDSIVVEGNVSASQQAADMSKMLYVTRMSKHEGQDSFATAIETLSTHYKLGSNPDILLAKADLLFVQCRFREALILTEAILEDDSYNFSALPVHLACLAELNEKNALFLLAHDLSDKHPEEPSTWLAVGVYYLASGKIAEARRMFSKSSLMDPHFGPAWIGFAHTFAAEGEHDQAIAAYTTSARLFQGTHLPQMFLGMQNLQLLNMTLAREYLTAAYNLCSTDPLLLNELGVAHYHEGKWSDAIEYFLNSIALSIEVGAEPRSWIATRVNLGHTYRRQQDFEGALEQFNEVLRHGGRDVGVLTAKALILLETNEPWDAVVTLHEALDVDAQDPIANDLLAKALHEHELVEIQEEAVDEQFDSILEERKKHARATNARRDKLSLVSSRKRRWNIGNTDGAFDSSELAPSNEPEQGMTSQRVSLQNWSREGYGYLSDTGGRQNINRARERYRSSRRPFQESTAGNWADDDEVEED